ncbi:MAG TPA: HEAT repeat domain-containing protein [Thermoanaerobaculia bacterium]|nr:HEAT repeat domain-containing protein [Thermoanaerobaculia bacterium]
MTATEQGKKFERRVGHLLALLGFRVEHDVLISGRQVDLLIEDGATLLPRQYIVECKDQAAPVSSQQYDAFRGRLMIAQRELSPRVRGIIVASVGFVKEVWAQSRNDVIDLLTVSQLEQNLIDFRQYIHDLARNLRSSASLEFFVEPRILREHLSVPEPALQYFERWLADSEANQLTLLGDYGTGKSTLLRYFALQLAQRFEKDVIEGGGRGRIPLFVDLREYRQVISFRQIILDLLDRNRVRSGSFDVFEYVSREGQLLLILDGFDEMATKGDYAVTLRNFREINKQAYGRAKIILSCRTHWFADAHDEQRVLQMMRPATPSLTVLYREIATRRNFSIAYLQEFERDQISKYLQTRCGKDAQRVESFIESTYNLADLSRRPVLLDMIVTTASTLAGKQGEVGPGKLYRSYTDIWLDSHDWSTLLDVDAKTEFLQNLAVHLWSDSSGQIPSEEIPRLISTWKPSVTAEERDGLDGDLRTAAFLVRDADGNYRFSHRSFLEFFFARHLIACAARKDPGPWATATAEVYRFLQDLLPDEEAAWQVLCEWIRDRGAPPAVRYHAIKAVTRVRKRQVGEALLDVLGDRNTDVALRRIAATALGGQNDVTAALARHFSESDEDPRVRANCAVALARIDTEASTALLTRLFEEVADWPSAAAMLVLRELRKSNRPAFVAAMLPSLVRENSRAVLREAIAVATRFPTPYTVDLCERLVRDHGSAIVVAEAFAALPEERRLPHVVRIAELLRSQTAQEPIAVAAAALRKVRIELVGEAALQLAESGNFNVRQIAIDILAADFPEVFLAHAAAWSSKSEKNPLSIRLRVIEAYAALHPPELGRFLERFLGGDERVAVKITALHLLAAHAQERLVDAITTMWPSERTTVIPRLGMELLFQADRRRAIQFILAHGIPSPRAGLRVGACAVLAAADAPEVTEALLDRLRKDHMRWVRIQALRSLASPGHSVSRAELLTATESETEEEVLAVRRELLGT